MAQALWVRVIRHHRVEQQLTVPCTRDDPPDALSEALRRLDIARPLWLEKNQHEWDNFGQTRFLADAFLEPIHFDRLEIEFIDPDAPKRTSRDIRNADIHLRGDYDYE